MSLGWESGIGRNGGASERMHSFEELGKGELRGGISERDISRVAAVAGGICEHLRPLLTHPDDTLLLHRMGEQLARGQVPQVVIEAIRVVRMTVLQKPDCGFRGIVTGDILRRLVGRTMPQTNSIVERCTAPFRYALTTRAGTQCVAHALQALTEAEPEATVMLLDGISAFDWLMLEGLCRICNKQKERNSQN